MVKLMTNFNKMMKKLLLCIAVFALAACSDEPTPEPEVVYGKKLVTFNAGHTSRTHFIENTNYWDASDCIGGFAEKNSNVKFSTSQDMLGYFSGSITTIDEEVPSFVLYYPYNATAKFANNILTSSLPAVQSLAEGSSYNVMPMSSQVDNFDKTVYFYNMCGVLRVKVSSKVARTLTKMVVTMNAGEPIAGNYTADLTDPTEPVLTMASGGSATVTLEGAVAMSANTEYTFLVILPPATYAEGLNITLEDSDGTTFNTADEPDTYKFTQELPMQRASLLTVGKAIDFPAPVDENGPEYEAAKWVWASSSNLISNVSTLSVAEATNLAEAGTANCYIASAAGTYSIPAVKPDGTPVDETCPNATIKFTLSGEEGNAVVAYTNEAGEILWSWHIWCTDKPADQSWNANTWLDRNLGAVTAVSGDVGSYGLMYQWGRKDPFPGSKLYSWTGTNDESSAFSTDYTYYTVANSGYGWKYESGVGLTVAEAIAQPMFMCQNATAADPDPSCADGSKNFNNVTRPWVAGMCAVEYSKLWLDDQKTIYDPCPAGYRVPTQAQVKADFSDLTDQFATSGKTNGLTLSSVNCWLPAAGYRTYDGNGKLFKVGTMGHYWTSTTYFPRSSNHHYGATFYTMAIRETTSGVYGITSNGQLKASENAAVRCVKE